ncbi:MAG: hypothetical protein U0R64_10175 [Candidatus Nanopelagicales bacterium]
MSVLVVYESMFGDARDVAQAIAAGAAETVVSRCVEVGQAPDSIDADVSLLVVGSPTHAFGLPRPESRADAAQRTEDPLVSPGRGVREWLAQVAPAADGQRAVTFDTRMTHPKMLTVMDHASHTSAKLLRKAGFTIAAESAHFHVEDAQGPLVDGELDRAREWGRSLAALV